MCCMLVARAQKLQQKPQQQKKKVTFRGISYLYGGLITSGQISKKMFDSLIAYPLVAKDSTMQDQPVLQFHFSYSERGVYEDSTGTPRIMTDHYHTESVKGKIPDDWVMSMRNRSKRGDTAIFYDILAACGDSLKGRFYAQPIKLVITD